MRIKEILNNVGHRSEGIPGHNWRFYQEWHNVIFLHWPVEYDELRPFVPEELAIDLYDEKPWVSLVAFTMEKVRFRYLPAFPPLSNFDEVNIRTYIRYKNKQGVYFLSMEAGNFLACKVARAISQLPYCFSKIKRTVDSYYLNNRRFNDRLRINYLIKGQKQLKTGLDLWLTERYALFQDNREGVINEYDIHHIEWPINEVEILNLDVSYNRFPNLIDNSPVLAHFSKGVQVLAWS